jgi:translation initiation factor RLI1
VDKQTQQNLLDKLLHVESLQELQRAASATAQLRKAHVQAHLELQSAVKERVAALQRLEQLAQQIEQRELSMPCENDIMQLV